jgi:hypothetical protein
VLARQTDPQVVQDTGGARQTGAPAQPDHRA